MSAERPWETLERLVATASRRELRRFLRQLPPEEIPLVVSRLSDEAQKHLLTKLRPREAAGLVEKLPAAEAAELVGELEPRTAAAILETLPSDEQADLLGDLAVDEAEAILQEMPAAAARRARELARYPDDVAGGLMVTEYLAYPGHFTVGMVLADMRRHAERYRDYDVQYCYVVDPEGHLEGVLRLRDLVLAPAGKPIRELMIPRPLSVRDVAPLQELREFFDRHPFLGAPVVDAEGHLLGVVHRAAVEEALADATNTDYRKAHGIVWEELRTMPVWLRARRRLLWLAGNIVLNLISASVIAFYQDTLQAAIALAVFLPIISDMSGNTGAQAMAVSMRELALGLVRPPEVVRVWLKEVTVGLINGTILGVLMVLLALLWKGNPYLGFVVGGAMALNTLVAVTVGGSLPLVLKRLRLDPALGSGPLLTTVTDLCGFFFVLSFATLALDRLRS